MNLSDIKDDKLRSLIAKADAEQNPVKQCPIPDKPKAGPNATEKEALDLLKRIGKSASCLCYEPMTFLTDEHEYTPDWGGGMVMVEVKGEYIHSRDSRLRFDSARLRHPELLFVWMRKRKATKKRGARWMLEIPI